MNPGDISRIAEIVNLIRPAWSTGLITTVLRDDRMIRRPHTDALIAMTVLALDPTTTRPGRVHERGAWWSAVETVSGGTGTSQTARTPQQTDCSVCALPQHVCEGIDKGSRSHRYEPRHELDRRVTSGRSARPTPEQRAAIDKANAESLAQVTAAKEAAEKKREIASVDDVLARHVSTTEENA